MLSQFKAFQADSSRFDLDELVAHAAFGKQLRAEYEALALEVPEFVDTQNRAIRREITARTEEKKAARIKEVKLRLDSLRTPAERRAELEAELKRLAPEEQLVGA
jgi:hypothetical protein